MNSIALAEALLCPPLDVEALLPLQKPLLAWFAENARPMPWRDNPTPYWVWLSEIMLQQTRVEAVRGYFDRFTKALPSVEQLALAREEELLKLWEGLGYYNRVRNLQKAAKVVCQRYGGKLPASYTQLLELPGIGEYTAGAIASIAFGIPVPAVDGNVYRVLSRMLQSYADTSRPAVKKAFRDLAQALLHPGKPGQFNQALMELGATVCLPNGMPLCERCPVAALCACRNKPCARELPVKAPKKARRIEQRTLLFLVAERSVLLFRRGETGLLAGLWEPLNLEGSLNAAQALSALRLQGIDAGPALPEPIAPSKHIFSHVEWHMTGYVLRLPPSFRELRPPGSLWINGPALAQKHPLPSAFSAYRASLEHWLA